MTTATAVFHPGEIAIQQRLGVDKKMDAFGRKVIRDFMPDQHREFYRQLPMLFAGFRDRYGDVWASVLTGNPGFISTVDSRALDINSAPLAGDPLQAELRYQQTLPQPDLRMGLLGIELDTRRRNRLSTELLGVSDSVLQLGVLQAFGNCPQYIQDRDLIEVPEHNYRPANPEQVTVLDESLVRFIESSDTFFVASSSQISSSGSDSGVEQGADVSHRGGRPGFIKVSGNTLTIPDYLGNNHFNTLGNLLVNPKAGLLFIDFQSGDVLTLTGESEVLFDSDEQAHFTGAERLWKFTVKRGYLLKAALPYRWQFDSYAPTSLMTGTWLDARQNQLAEQQNSKLNSYRVNQMVKESSQITSFYLTPKSGPLPKFKPGQFINLRISIDGHEVTRQYSVSSAPGDELLRISVKKDIAEDGTEGLVSHHLHRTLKVGDELILSQPGGQFTLDASQSRPAVLLSAGVGITPMMSMLRHVLHERVRTRNLRQITMINSVKDERDLAFYKEISSLADAGDQGVNVYWMVSRPQKPDSLDNVTMYNGRLQKRHLQQLLPIDHYEFFLCGPPGYMQSTYDLLLELGVDDSAIQAEAFGPATLERKSSPRQTQAAPLDEATNAVVQFKKSGVEQAWTNTHPNLLAFSEAHGLTPEYGCRNGQCGMCKVKVIEGQVVHSGQASFDVEGDEALLCCAKPASTNGDEVPVLTLDV